MVRQDQNFDKISGGLAGGRAGGRAGRQAGRQADVSRRRRAGWLSSVVFAVRAYLTVINIASENNKIIKPKYPGVWLAISVLAESPAVGIPSTRDIHEKPGRRPGLWCLSPQETDLRT